MAYGIKYRFRYVSIHGVDYTVNIMKDGYSGNVIQRSLGKSPVLRKAKNDCIYSTSLTVTAECAVDGEFADFYSLDPGEFLVSLFRGNTEIWQGSLMTEVFDAPEIAPPYDIQIVANDGIAEAKLHNFVPQGAITLKEMFRYLLADTPVSRSIYMVSGIGATSLTPANFLNTALINLDYMEGMTKYEVLAALLKTLHATITVHNSDWLIVRETDVQVSNGSVPCLFASSRQSSVSETSIANAVKSAGQMGVADVWPVGHLSTHVVPAKRRISVEAPWHAADGIPSVPNNEWTIVDTSIADATFDNGTYLYPHNTSGTYGEVYATIPLRSFTSDLKLSLWLSKYGTAARVSSNAIIWAIFYPSVGDNLYYDGEEWTTSSKKMTSVSPPRGNAEHGAEFSFDIPCPENAGAGTLVISVEGRWLRLHNASLFAVLGKGFKDTISISNGARGEGETVEIAGGRVTDGTVISEAFLQGVFLLPSGAAALNFYDRLFPNMNLTFMSLAALGYAASVALPRLQLTGVVDVPSSAGVLPLLLSYRGVNYWIETFELDTREEELRIEALSLPAAQLTVESEVVTELMGVSSDGGVGGGGGGSAATMISAFLTRENIVSLIADGVTIQDLYADRAVHDGAGNEIATTYMKVADNFFELDGNGNVKLKDAYGGLWAKGFVTAGGIGSNQGGGGVDIDRVWESLTNNTDKPDVKINAAHIPVATTGSIGGVKVDGTSITINNGIISAVAQGTGSVNSLTVGSQNYTPDANGVITIPAYPTTLPASDVYAWAKASTKPSYALSEITDASDVKAIEALTGTGILKRTGNNTWTLDSSSYITGITASMINSALGFTLSGSSGSTYNLANFLTAVPKATDSVIGGFQTGYSESGKNYAVKMSGNKAYVNVPWTDTVYTHPTDGANVTISAANGKVLSAITVNSQGHVTSVSSKTLAKADIPALDYLPLTGGELTGDLWLHTGSSNYGSKLWFGDKGNGDGYVYLHEDSDDHLHIHADKGLQISTGSNYGIQLDNKVTLNSARSFTFGNGVLTWDANMNAWKLTGNLYATGFITSGAANPNN